MVHYFYVWTCAMLLCMNGITRWTWNAWIMNLWIQIPIKITISILGYISETLISNSVISYCYHNNICIQETVPIRVTAYKMQCFLWWKSPWSTKIIFSKIKPYIELKKICKNVDNCTIWWLARDFISHSFTNPSKRKCYFHLAFLSALHKWLKATVNIIALFLLLMLG